jgi:hypothetical protein
MQPELRLASMPVKNSGPDFLRDPLTLKFVGAVSHRCATGQE